MVPTLRYSEAPLGPVVLHLRKGKKSQINTNRPSPSPRPPCLYYDAQAQLLPNVCAS